MTYITPVQESWFLIHSLSLGATLGKVLLAWSQCTVGAEFHAGFKHIHCTQTRTILTNPFPWCQGWWDSLFTKRNNSCKCLPLPREWFSRGTREKRLQSIHRDLPFLLQLFVLFMQTSPDTTEQEKMGQNVCCVEINQKIPLMPGFLPNFQEELRISSRKDLSCSRGWWWITRI